MLFLRVHIIWTCFQNSVEALARTESEARFPVLIPCREKWENHAQCSEQTKKDNKCFSQPYFCQKWVLRSYHHWSLVFSVNNSLVIIYVHLLLEDQCGKHQFFIAWPHCHFPSTAPSAYTCHYSRGWNMGFSVSYSTSDGSLFYSPDKIFHQLLLIFVYTSSPSMSH